jgi:hypothetical protein
VGRYRERFEHSAAWRVGGRKDPRTVMETPYYHRPLVVLPSPEGSRLRGDRPRGAGAHRGVR